MIENVQRNLKLFDDLEILDESLSFDVLQTFRTSLRSDLRSNIKTVKKSDSVKTNISFKDELSKRTREFDSIRTVKLLSKEETFSRIVVEISFVRLRILQVKKSSFVVVLVTKTFKRHVEETIGFKNNKKTRLSLKKVKVDIKNVVLEIDNIMTEMIF